MIPLNRLKENAKSVITRFENTGSTRRAHGNGLVATFALALPSQRENLRAEAGADTSTSSSDERDPLDERTNCPLSVVSVRLILRLSDRVRHFKSGEDLSFNAVLVEVNCSSNGAAGLPAEQHIVGQVSITSLRDLGLLLRTKDSVRSQDVDVA